MHNKNMNIIHRHNTFKIQVFLFRTRADLLGIFLIDGAGCDAVVWGEGKLSFILLLGWVMDCIEKLLTGEIGGEGTVVIEGTCLVWALLDCEIRDLL